VPSGTNLLKTLAVRRVQDAAQRYNGSCIFPFSQCLEPVSSMIGKSKVTEDGICQALSEMWVVHHAHDGSLWNWLYRGGQLRSSALAQIAYNFSLGSGIASGQSYAITDQDMNSDLWLMQHGIRRRTNALPQMTNRFVGGKMQRVAQAGRSLTTGSREDSGIFSSLCSYDVGIKLGRALVSGSMVTNMGQGDGTYRILAARGRAGGHTMAAFVGSDAVFFDPNFGEFYFPDRADLARFIGADFWGKSWYSVILSQSYEIRDYARAIGEGHKEFTGRY